MRDNSLQNEPKYIEQDTKIQHDFARCEEVLADIKKIGSTSDQFGH